MPRRVTAGKPLRRLDLNRVRTYPLAKRRSKVGSAAVGKVPKAGMRLSDFLDSLPNILAAHDLRTIAKEIAARHQAGRLILMGMGAHPIKVGLSPLIIDLMQRGIIGGVALNGACIVHDFELAYHGETSEDVGPGLTTGTFGMAEETGRFLNRAIESAPRDGLGLAVGQAILEAEFPHAHLSILAAGARLGIPVTVHVAIGTDIIHMHPAANGAAIGTASLADFRLLAGLCQHLDRGVFLNLGSAVLIPEVFLKALNLARNVGRRVGRLVTVNMDFLRHYRAQVNVVERPTAPDGKGYQLIGHHEIMFPLLCASIFEELLRTSKKPRRTAPRGSASR